MTKIYEQADKEVQEFYGQQYIEKCKSFFDPLYHTLSFSKLETQKLKQIICSA